MPVPTTSQPCTSAVCMALVHCNPSCPGERTRQARAPNVCPHPPTRNRDAAVAFRVATLQKVCKAADRSEAHRPCSKVRSPPANQKSWWRQIRCRRGRPHQLVHPNNRHNRLVLALNPVVAMVKERVLFSSLSLPTRDQNCQLLQITVKIQDPR